MYEVRLAETSRTSAASAVAVIFVKIPASGELVP